MGVETLQDLRKAAEKTLEESGAALDITKGAYHKKEKGYRPLTTVEAAKLAILWNTPLINVVLAANRVAAMDTKQHDTT